LTRASRGFGFWVRRFELPNLVSSAGRKCAAFFVMGCDGRGRKAHAHAFRHAVSFAAKLEAQNSELETAARLSARLATTDTGKNTPARR
jgi:hypothetical protein